MSHLACKVWICLINKSKIQIIIFFILHTIGVLFLYMPLEMLFFYLATIVTL